MPMIEISCPICGTTTKTLPRYPRRVCSTCAAKASDESGPSPGVLLFAGLTPCVLALFMFAGLTAQANVNKASTPRIGPANR